MSFTEWLSLCFVRYSSEDCSYLLAIRWSLWFHRNKHVWEATVSKPFHIVKFASNYLENWPHEQVVSKDVSYPVTFISFPWSPPLFGVIKVNVDIATNVHGNSKGIGYGCMRFRWSFYCCLVFYCP